jgi:hypothetical protein
MKYLVEFKAWNDGNLINEQDSQYYIWDFKATDSDASGKGKTGFSSFDSFNNYRKGGYPLANGLTKNMDLLEWMNTDGFAKCEKRILKRVGDAQSKTALESFKEKLPEKYAMFVVYATHDSLPKDYKEDKVSQIAPLDLGKNAKIYAADFYSNSEAPGTPGGSTDPKPTDIPPEEFPSVRIEIPQDLDTSDFFEFNSWTLSDKFKKWVTDNVINPSKETISKLNPPEGKPKSYLNSLKITTSSSTIPNGVSPEDKKKHTFAELSDLRAESAIKYLKEELAKIGVLIDGDSKIEKSTKGTNAGKKSTVAYASQPIGADLTGTSGEEWDKTDDDKQTLKKYQMVQIDSRLIFNTTKKAESVKGAETKPEPMKTDPAKPIVVTEKAFHVEITAAEKPTFKKLLPKFNRPNIDFGRIFRFMKKDTRGSYKCPKF